MIDFVPAPASLPPGQRVYAIGDVHGCLDRLQAIHELIAEDLAARPAEEAVLVHLGDYVDRGPDSAGVVARLAAGAPSAGRAHRQSDGQSRAHDARRARHRRDRERPSCGWPMAARIHCRAGVSRVQRSPRSGPAYLPMPHLMFLRDLAMRHEAGGYLFVHAGIRPGIPLDRQSRHDLMWIREPFLSWKKSFGPVVVHGHTPTAGTGGAAQSNWHRYRRRDGRRADLRRAGRAINWGSSPRKATPCAGLAVVQFSGSWQTDHCARQRDMLAQAEAHARACT